MNTCITSFEVKIMPFYGWRSINIGSTVCHVAGNGKYFKDIVVTLSELKLDLGQLKNFLRNETDVFSYVILDTNGVFASVDRIKSYPLFYGIDSQNKLYVSNCPYTIKERANLKSIDDKALLEFSMTSYTLGRKTLYQSLYQLQAGEFLVWRRYNFQWVVHRYYFYFPKEETSLSRAHLIEEHASIMDRVIDRVIDKANGRLICLPLSGGLDSRILLTKLVEKKYDRILAISYGLRGNFEAKMARHVAQELRVAWQFFPAKPHLARQLYQTKERFDYARWASALHTVPSYLEYETLYHLTCQRMIPSDSIIVNGQTGDFITGGHLPKLILETLEPNFNDLVAAIIKKHASLWHPLLNKENRAYIYQEISNCFSKSETIISKSYLLALYESWEWQERQCKAVVSGQRLYDFFHYDWHLPLWDPELMDFWSKVPFVWKMNQSLYIDYLQTYYPKLFTVLRPVAEPWVMRFKWIPLFAKFYELLFGCDKKNSYYKRMYYYGTDYNQYALLGRKFYLKYYKDVRGFVSLLVHFCLDEWGLYEKNIIE